MQRMTARRPLGAGALAVGGVMEIPIVGEDEVHWVPEEEVSQEDLSSSGSPLNALQRVFEGDRAALAPFKGRSAHGIPLLSDAQRAVQKWIDGEIDITDFYTDSPAT